MLSEAAVAPGCIGYNVPHYIFWCPLCPPQLRVIPYIHLIYSLNISQITHITYLISSLSSPIEGHKRASYKTFYFIFLRNQTWGVIFCKVLFVGLQIVLPCLFHIYQSWTPFHIFFFGSDSLCSFVWRHIVCPGVAGGAQVALRHTDEIFWYWISGYYENWYQDILHSDVRWSDPEQNSINNLNEICWSVSHKLLLHLISWYQVIRLCQISNSK